MGRIRTTLIKRIGKELVEKYSDKFKEDFEHNKKAVLDVAGINSKKLRNVIAGYITQLVKKSKI